jgi:hypothetical protein
MAIPIKNNASARAISRFVKFTMSFARDEGLKELFQKSANSKRPFLRLLYQDEQGTQFFFVLQKGKLELTL